MDIYSHNTGTCAIEEPFFKTLQFSRWHSKNEKVALMPDIKTLTTQLFLGDVILEGTHDGSNARATKNCPSIAQVPVYLTYL